jgi:hypothetical protein
MTRHEHQWSEWGDWYYDLYTTERTDVRDRDCQVPDCGETDTQSRVHEHTWNRYPDPYAPVGTGLLVTMCSGCHEVKP